MRLVHSEMRLMASVVAVRLGLVDTTAIGCCSEPSCDAILGTVVVVISSGYSLVTGRLVYPVLVRMCAARTRPSPPLIRFFITASFQVDLGPFLWTDTTSPVLTDCTLVPVVLWNSRRDVRYSCLHLFQKCSRIWACVVICCLMSDALP